MPCSCCTPFVASLLLLLSRSSPPDRQAPFVPALRLSGLRCCCNHSAITVNAHKAPALKQQRRRREREREGVQPEECRLACGSACGLERGAHGRRAARARVHACVRLRTCSSPPWVIICTRARAIHTRSRTSQVPAEGTNQPDHPETWAHHTHSKRCARCRCCSWQQQRPRMPALAPLSRLA